MQNKSELQFKPRARYFPLLAWLPTYPRTWLRADLIAGLTVAALLIPEGMAYAQIAGVPPQTAFYAAPFAKRLGARSDGAIAPASHRDP